MSVGFGFSAGDFISALELVATVVDALRESGLASTEYRGLVRQLDLLETALRKVNRIELDDSQHAEGVALRQAAAQCQRTIDEFWKKNVQKYQPSLKAGGSGNRVKDGWMKIKWALYQREDLAKFKADLAGHTESINLIMMTTQMGAVRIDSKKNGQHHRTLARKVQDSYFGCMQRMAIMLERVSTSIKQGKELLEMTAEVIQTNLRIFQVVLDIQNLITHIPGQVDRQQPVYFVDALGRHAPFHLEFILSAEALTSVLQSNFKNIGSGAEKIGRGEFAIQDSATKSDVDLASPWETCFRPGQRVAMSMIFDSALASIMYCPTCREDNGDDFAEDEDLECRKCAMVYRRSISWTKPQPLPSFSMRLSQVMPPLKVDDGPCKASPFVISALMKRKFLHDVDEDMALFRRVRLKTSILDPFEDSDFNCDEALQLLKTKQKLSRSRGLRFKAIVRRRRRRRNS